jgi:hypothetical protein
MRLAPACGSLLVLPKDATLSVVWGCWCQASPPVATEYVTPEAKKEAGGGAETPRQVRSVVWRKNREHTPYCIVELILNALR